MLLDRHTGRPIVDRDLRELLDDRGQPQIADLLELGARFPQLRAAEVNPPLFMDVSSVYSGDELALPYRDIMGEGIVGSGDLAVTAHGGANSIDLAAGACWVKGDTDANAQPTYRMRNDAVVNLGITVDPSNPRIVLVVAQITDATFAGGSRQWQLVAIHGTPAASPSVPALPASALPLAQVLVPAAAASSAAYTITDVRQRAQVFGGAAQISACRLRRAALKTITTSTLTAIDWDTEDYDTDNLHNNATNPTRVTIKTAGIYSVKGHVTWAAAATGVREAFLQVNGATRIDDFVGIPGGDVVDCPLSTDYSLNPGDYIELIVFQNAGANRDVSAAANRTPFLAVARIG